MGGVTEWGTNGRRVCWWRQGFVRIALRASRQLARRPNPVNFRWSFRYLSCGMDRGDDSPRSLITTIFALRLLYGRTTLISENGRRRWKTEPLTSWML